MAKTTFTTVALFTLLQSAAAHYYFPHLVFNGSTSPEFKYVRDVASAYPDEEPTDPNDFNGKEAPVKGEFGKYDMNDVRCGRNAFAAANKTETATIEAGSEVGFHMREYEGRPDLNNGIWHPGPLQVYMSKSDDLANYAGDGDWFKIYYLGPNSTTSWGVNRLHQVDFVIPETTPPGTYLLRFESLFPLKAKAENSFPGDTQWYVNCAHVNIVGSGGGKPGPTIKIPDDYSSFDIGIGLTVDGLENDSGLDKYVPPGPAVWTGKKGE